MIFPYPAVFAKVVKNGANKKSPRIALASGEIGLS